MVQLVEGERRANLATMGGRRAGMDKQGRAAATWCHHGYQDAADQQDPGVLICGPRAAPESHGVGAVSV